MSHIVKPKFKIISDGLFRNTHIIDLETQTELLVTEFTINANGRDGITVSLKFPDGIVALDIGEKEK